MSSGERIVTLSVCRMKFCLADTLNKQRRIPIDYPEILLANIFYFRKIYLCINLLVNTEQLIGTSADGGLGL